MKGLTEMLMVAKMVYKMVYWLANLKVHVMDEK